MTLAHERRDYQARTLDEASALADPVAQFRRWLDEALAVELLDATAMTLATVDATGAPDARIVLLKDVGEQGFTFFTNYDSGKGLDLAGNPRACLVFFWAALERQVRVRGSVSRLDAAAADAYFASRPIGSQHSALASPQSQVVASREVLETRLAAVAATWPSPPVPRPPHWGGYCLRPVSLEFWQGRANRLHDRLRYTRAGTSWHRVRLAP